MCYFYRKIKINSLHITYRYQSLAQKMTDNLPAHWSNCWVWVSVRNATYSLLYRQRKAA